MKLFKVEFFDKDFNYVGSHEIGDFDFEYDYLSLSVNDIEVLESTECEVGNIIYISSLVDTEQYIGIVTAIDMVRGSKKVKFKTFLEYLNVKVVYDPAVEVEQWIANKLLETYVSNTDIFQRIPIRPEIITRTPGTLEADDENTLFVNLYEMVELALRKYQITVNFSLDLKDKRIICKIGKNTSPIVVIEADLPNIIEAEITVKTNDDSAINKLYVVNSGEKSTGEEVIYCRHSDGTIDTDLENDRLMPVIFDYAVIEVAPEEFEQKARERAEADLAQDKLDNLIEITCIEDDSLVNPGMYEIGQEVSVISNGKVFNSILTGIKYNRGERTLIFGAIRLELTKILKRRLKK